MCQQETKWKENKARNIRGGFKVFYSGADEGKIGQR